MNNFNYSTDFEKLARGMKVLVQTFAGEYHTGVIDEVCMDVKNGFPGIDYTTLDGDGFWCYADQIVSWGK